ncbi:MAG: dicarboxylate/amino acid:cation symporter [Bacteroidia bacterium]|nr:dicarboxylate/amino acid:cation symporter [Bacteroidia bacterium]
MLDTQVKTSNKKLLQWIALALVFGVLAGWWLHHEALEYSKKFFITFESEVSKVFYEKKIWPVISKGYMQPFSLMSEIFLRMIKMIIAPLIISILISGVAKMGDAKMVGRLGLKTMIYFTLATIVALLLGLMIVNWFEPGRKMNLPLPAGAEHPQLQKQTASNFIAHIIPSSVIKSMADNDILPIVVFAVFFGLACTKAGSPGLEVAGFFEKLSGIMFKVTEMVMYFAPLGIFGAITATLIQQGIGIVTGYLYLIGCFFGGLLIFVLVILFGVCILFSIPFFRLLNMIKEPVLLAFSTASSESAMPQTIGKLEEFGISHKVVSFVLPLGYSFNLDGSIMYMTFATMFIAQSYGMDLSAADQIKMMLILLITSKGMAGVPRASLVVIAGMLATFHIPQEGLLLLLGIDQILDMGRSAVNVVGNAVAAAVVGRWEGERY